MPDQPVPHGIRVTLRTFVSPQFVDLCDAADAEDEPGYLLADGMAGLAVEENERLLAEALIEEQFDQRLLAGAAENPACRKRWFFVGRQLLGQAFLNRFLVSAQHPPERHCECGVRRHRDTGRFKMAMSHRGRWNFVIRVLENPKPLLLVHEGAGFGFAGWKLFWFQNRKRFERLFRGGIFFLADAIQGRAKRVSRGRSAHSAVPAIVVPSHAERKVEHGSPPYES